MSLENPSRLERIIKAIQDHYIIALIILALVVMMTVWGINSYENRKIQEIQSNVDEHKGEANVIENLIVNQQQVVNGKEKNTNEAVNELHNSINHPSNQFNGNGASDRFCSDFPTDPSCK